jgi:F-type H+-transporting ATPase subunit a
MSSFSLGKIFLFATILLASISNAFCNQENDSLSSLEKKAYDPVPDIMHHISDSHEWHFWGEGEGAATLSLPIILWTDNGLVGPFLSSKFHHNDNGQIVVIVDGHSLVKIHDKIYELNQGQKSAVFDESHHIKNGILPLDFSITKNVACMLIAFFLLLLFFIISGIKAKNNKTAPSGLLSFLEPLVLFVRDDIVKPNIGKNYKKYLPYLLTLFFFILMNNLLGLIPGSANVTGNIAITLVLSFITLIVTNFSGNKSYWGHIFNPPGVPLALMPIMIPIEIVGIFTKPFALMIRLFANITAGHIIVLSLVSLIFMAQSGLGDIAAWSLSPVAVVFVLFMDLIEVLVAFLQAYIFTLLTSLFIGLATVEEH